LKVLARAVKLGFLKEALRAEEPSRIADAMALCMRIREQWTGQGLSEIYWRMGGRAWRGDARLGMSREWEKKRIKTSIERKIRSHGKCPGWLIGSRWGILGSPQDPCQVNAPSGSTSTLPSLFLLIPWSQDCAELK